MSEAEKGKSEGEGTENSRTGKTNLETRCETCLFKNTSVEAAGGGWGQEEEGGRSKVGGRRCLNFASLVQCLDMIGFD